MTTLRVDGVAQELSMSPDWFRRVRGQLEAEGFPKPLPLPSARGKRGRRPLIWSLEAVRDWIRNPVRAPRPGAPQPGSMVKVSARDTAAMRERF